MNEDTPIKSIFRSKTAIVNALVLAAGLVPSIQEFVRENPEAVVTIIGAVNIGLRLITKSKVQLFPKG